MFELSGDEICHELAVQVVKHVQPFTSKTNEIGNKIKCLRLSNCTQFHSHGLLQRKSVHVFQTQHYDLSFKGFLNLYFQRVIYRSLYLCTIIFVIQFFVVWVVRLLTKYNLYFKTIKGDNYNCDILLQDVSFCICYKFEMQLVISPGGVKTWSVFQMAAWNFAQGRVFSFSEFWRKKYPWIFSGTLSFNVSLFTSVVCYCQNG